MANDDSDTPTQQRYPEPEDELASIVGGLRSHLGWLAGQGMSHVPAAPSPRYAEPVEEAPQTEPLPDEDTSHGADVQTEAGGGEESSLLSNPGLGSAGLAAIRDCLGDCHRCRLSQDRVQVVFGQGNPDAELMFVGEAPGRDEDLQGEAFIGAAGQLLTKMIKAMGFEREQVFIGNVIKCRPPRNRNPEPEEIARCQPFLMAQIRAIQPSAIVTLGRFAAQTLLQSEQSIGRLRGRLHPYTLDGRQMILSPTYHPAYLLRNPDAKRPVWEDLQLIIGWLKERGLA